MNLSFTLDGQPIEIETDASTPVLDILRESCGRKDIKQGCSPQGSCGSCMTIIKGKPRLSCTLRAKNIAKKSIETIASIDPKRRHTIEQALIAHGATGCGYCMPSIVHQIATLLDYEPNPTEILINRALHMHACPCLGFTAIKRAIDAIINDTPLPSGNIHPRGRLALRGQRSRVADISVDGMLHLIPVFTEITAGRILSVDIPEAPENIIVLSAQNSSSGLFQTVDSEFSRSDALIAMVLSEDRMAAAGFAEQIRSTYSALTIQEKEIDTLRIQQSSNEDIKSTLQWVNIKQTIPAQDPGYLEAEACFVNKERIIVNGLSLHDLQKRYPTHKIEAWAAGGGSCGRKIDSWVDWAVYASQQLSEPVLLSLTMADSIRIRPKSPPTELDLSMGYQQHGTIVSLKGNIRIDCGSTPALCRDLPKLIGRNIILPYAIKNIDINIQLTSKQTIACAPLHDQGMRIVSVGLEGLVDKMRETLQMDAISVRKHNLRATTHKALLEEITDDYLQCVAEQENASLVTLACASFSPAEEQTESARILIAEKDLIVVQGVYPDTGDFTEYRSIEIVHQYTGIPLANIAYEVISDFAPASSSRTLQLKALEYAALSLAERLQSESISALIGLTFSGEATLDVPELVDDIKPSFAVSIATFTPEGQILNVHSITQGQFSRNAAISQSYLEGIQYRSLGQETVLDDGDFQPKQLFRQLNIPKAKSSPQQKVDAASQVEMTTEEPLSASVFSLHSIQQKTE